jgi:hypothetical protein
LHDEYATRLRLHSLHLIQHCLLRSNPGSVIGHQLQDMRPRICSEVLYTDNTEYSGFHRVRCLRTVTLSSGNMRVLQLTD